MPIADGDPPFRGVGRVLFRKVASNLELSSEMLVRRLQPDVYFATVVRASFGRLGQR